MPTLCADAVCQRCVLTLLLLPCGCVQVSSQKIMTETDLQGIAVSKGDFVLGQLSPLVNSRSRNKLVLASYLEQCTEPDPRGEAARTPEQQRQHEIISRERARLVTVALQKSDRRKEAKAEEKRRAAAAAAAAAASAADTSDSSDEEPEGEEEEEDEEKEEGEMFPLPPGVTPEQLTGGLTMAGRRAVRRTIAFAVDIKHAEAMNVVFNAAGGRSLHWAVCPGTVLCGSWQRLAAPVSAHWGYGRFHLRCLRPGSIRHVLPSTMLQPGVCCNCCGLWLWCWACRCPRVCHPQHDAT